LSHLDFLLQPLSSEHFPPLSNGHSLDLAVEEPCAYAWASIPVKLSTMHEIPTNATNMTNDLHFPTIIQLPSKLLKK
jgi:hypothetical protein